MKIWSYWHSPYLDHLTTKCVESWRRYTGFDVVVLNHDSVRDFIDPQRLPSTFEQLTPTLQSDLIRLHLLVEYGGIWLDTTVLLNRSFENWASLNDTVAYYGFYYRTEYPESWCLV